MSDLVSIIVPVYNVEPYIHKCLDSLLAQTYKNIEIILIDDGSTDNSGTICDEYENMDSRITVYHTENRGLSAARNLGLSVSHGDYIMFVDSDDWVESDFCRIPYEAAKEVGADLVMFQFNEVEKDNKTVRYNRNLKEGLVDTNTALDLVFFSGISWAPWNKLYKKELFTGIMYPQGRYHEDTATTHRLVIAAKKTYIIDCPLYNYRRNRLGNITSIFDSKHLKDYLDMNRQRADDLKAFGYPNDKSEYYEVQAALKYLIHSKRQKDPDWEWCCKLIKKTTVLKSEYKDHLLAKGRLMIRLFKLNPILFDFVCRVLGKKSLI